MPSGSRMDLPLAKAKPIRNDSNASVITYLRRKKSYWVDVIVLREERSEDMRGTTMKTPRNSNRGSLPLVRRRKGMIGPTGLCGLYGLAHQIYKEAEVSLRGDKWEKHPLVTGPEAPCILGIDYLRRGYFIDPKGYRWSLGVATVNTEKIIQLSTLTDLSEDPFIMGLMQVEDQQVPVAARTLHWLQYRTNRDSIIPIHKLIRQLENQGEISRTHSPFNSPIWPV
ncbi:hypothetical protein BTVI_41911 [Pitangus sulphuratus]|nr:hypothetical protein BTVI_41911 [Pitangus sulphuratus]